MATLAEGQSSCLALGSRRRLAQDQPVARCPSGRCRSKAHSSWRAWNARGEWSILWGFAGSPRFQGKVERSHRSDKQAFYQLLTYTGDLELNEKLVEWENFYNDQRSHGRFQGKTLSEALRDVRSSDELHCHCPARSYTSQWLEHRRSSRPEDSEREAELVSCDRDRSNQ